MSKLQLTGLVAAVHSPFNADGSLNLAVCRKTSRALAGEWRHDCIHLRHDRRKSFTHARERRALATRWTEVARGTSLKIVVHVGATASLILVYSPHRRSNLATGDFGARAELLSNRNVAALVSVRGHRGRCARVAVFYYDIP